MHLPFLLTHKSIQSPDSLAEKINKQIFRRYSNLTKWQAKNKKTLKE